MDKKPLPKIGKSFCLSPWNQLHVTPIGVVKPCCIFDGGLKDENNKVIRISDDKIENIWNGSGFKKLRQDMLNDNFIPECKKCYEEEKVSNFSERIYSFKANDFLLESILDSQVNVLAKELPYILNLKIGNKCNLKCRMCQPLDSAMIDTEFSQISHANPLFRSFDNANAFDYNYDVLPIEMAGDWISNPIAQSNMLSLLTNTVHLSLAGGETTFTQEALDILNFCVEKKIAKNITVLMSSNLTRLDDSLIELMAKFKYFKVIASIDGIENAGEYIRFPSKWNTILKNLKKLAVAPDNVIPVIAPTIQIYNVLSIVPILDLIEELNCTKWNIHQVSPIHLTVLFDPQHLSIRHLPKSIKEVALEKLLNFKARSKLLHSSKDYQNQFDLLVETLRQENFDSGNQYSSNDYLSFFMQYTQDLDKQRGQRFQDFLPELYNLLQKEKIIARYPSNDPKNYTYFKYRDSGFRFQSEGKTQEALEMFSKAYGMFQKDVDLLFSMAICYKLQNDHLNVYKFLRETEAIDQNHFFTLVELGNYHMLQNEFHEASSYFNKAINNAGVNNKDYIQENIKICHDQIKKGFHK